MQATKPLTKPNKQRRMRYLAPAHLRHKLMAAHLSPELRASHGVRSFPVRTGDTVRVVRGDHKGVEGKITSVKLSKYRIFVDGLTREKVDGTTINVPIHPSKVMVTRLNLDDKWRKEILDLKKEGRKKLEKAEKAVKKPAPKPELKPEEKTVKVEEEAKEVAEEKPAVKAKVAKKKPAPARKKPARKKKAEKAVPEAKEAKPEAKREPKEKTKPPTKPKRTSRKTAKKTEEGEE